MLTLIVLCGPLILAQNGQTPLHLAAMAGHHWIVEVFLLCDTSCLNEQDKVMMGGVKRVKMGGVKGSGQE